MKHCVTILSFLLLSACLRLTSSYLDFLPFLRNAFHLNTASLLRAVHGSIVPFPLTFYGCLPSHMHCLNAVLSPPIAQPSFPFTYIRLSLSTMNTAWPVRHILTYLNDNTSCILFNFNLLDSPLLLNLSESSHYS